MPLLPPHPGSIQNLQVNDIRSLGRPPATTKQQAPELRHILGSWHRFPLSKELPDLDSNPFDFRVYSQDFLDVRGFSERKPGSNTIACLISLRCCSAEPICAIVPISSHPNPYLILHLPRSATCQVSFTQACNGLAPMLPTIA
jgi:hypothetical protein